MSESQTMAACGSLQHIFEKPLPESPTLLESLSPWNQITSPKPIEASSFTEIFGELHFKDNQESPVPISSSSSSPSLPHIYQSPQPAFVKTDHNGNSPTDYVSRTQYVGCHRHSDSFSSMNSESLQLCTEGLGFESSDEVEDLNDEMGSDNWQNKVRTTRRQHTIGELRRSRSAGRSFPPPISSIGKSGKPWVCFKSYRNEGRFVLKEIRMPTQEFLRAEREDGRLKLQLCMSDEEIYEDEEEEVEEEDEDEDEDEEENNGGDDVDVISEKNGENGDGKNLNLNNKGGEEC